MYGSSLVIYLHSEHISRWLSGKSTQPLTYTRKIHNVSIFFSSSSIYTMLCTFCSPLKDMPSTMPKLIHRRIQDNMLFAAIMSRITRSPQLTNEFSGNNFWCYLFSRLPQFPFRSMSSFEMTSAVLPVRFVCPHARITLNVRTIYCSLGTHNGMRKTNIAFRLTSIDPPHSWYRERYILSTHVYIHICTYIVHTCMWYSRVQNRCYKNVVSYIDPICSSAFSLSSPSPGIKITKNHINKFV